MLRLSDMTWEEVEALDRANAIAILPVGAVEAHGPHLPLRTDVVISEAMAEAGAAALEARGQTAIVLPALPYTTAAFAEGFAGTISVKPETVTSLVAEVATSLARQGIPVLAIANSHLDPGHLASLHAAVEACRAEPIRVVFPDLTRRPWAGRLTEEFRTGACHAGRYETSVVMAARPELVRDGIRRGLVPNPSSLSEAIRGGITTFEGARGPRAYFGWPADATEEEGARTIEALGAILADAVREDPA